MPTHSISTLRMLVVLFIGALGGSACAGSNSARSDTPESCRSENYEERRAASDEEKEECSDCRPPEIIGGMEALYDHVSYPRKAREIEAEGTSWIQFIVSTEGETTEARVCQTAGNSILDREAWEAVQQLEWRPGIIKGKPTEVRITLPVRFALN